MVFNISPGHPYGDLNLAEKKQDMLNTFQRIATLVSEYKKWSEENKASEKTTLQKVKVLGFPFLHLLIFYRNYKNNRLLQTNCNPF